MKNNKLQLIQFSRGIAALIVVLYHTSTLYATNLNYSVYNNAFKFGKTGVDFFFVLSGFIIFIIHERDFGVKSRLSQYITKRFIRIFPLYWIVLAYKIVTTNESPGTYIASILLLPIVSPPLVSVSWTLSYEILFYIIFGVLIISNNKIVRKVLFFYIAFLTAFWLYNVIYEINPVSKFKFFYSYYYLEFFLGVCAGYIYKNNIAFKARYVMVLAGLVLFFTFSYLAVKNVNAYASVNHIDLVTKSESLKSFYETFSFIFFGIPSFLIVAGIALIDKIDKIVLNKYYLLLGDSSFSIYLVHSSLLNIFTKLIDAKKISIFYSIIPTIVLCVIIGLVFHKLVEAPLLNRMNSIIKSRKMNKKYLEAVK